MGLEAPRSVRIAGVGCTNALDSIAHTSHHQRTTNDEAAAFLHATGIGRSLDPGQCKLQQNTALNCTTYQQAEACSGTASRHED